MNSPSSRSAVRSQLRNKRRSLTPRQRQQNQQLVLKHLKRSALLKRHHRFAIYLDADGELPTRQIIETLQALKKKVYLPVLYPLSENRLWFVPYHPDKIQFNRFNIVEPANIDQRIPAQFLDVIFMPLVGFDLQGNRLGMGGGFYDRSLSSNKLKSQSRLPLRIGLAHEVQRSTDIISNHWDIQLNGVITEQQFYHFSSST